MKFKSIVLFSLISVTGFAQNSALQHHSVKVVELFKVQGYLEHLPPDYESNPTKKYPLLVFLHGTGERGSTPADMYKVVKNGPPKEIERQGSLCFDINGKQECFIVLSPQLTGSGNWTGYVQEEFWQYILNGPEKYRIDPNRIYLTGLSLGGNGVWERAYSNENANNILAAAAPLCAWGNNSKGCIVADRNIPIWAFHGTSDDVIGFNAGLSIFNAVNDCPTNTQQNTFTAIEGGEHWIWNDVYKTDHSQYNPNIYEWLLSHTLDNNSNTMTGNQPPTVSAGQDITVEAGVTSVNIDAEASDADGSITSYRWEKISGPAVSLSQTSSAHLKVNSPSIGTYEFKITVTDDENATAADRLYLQVTDTKNTSPTVDAGEDVMASLTYDHIYLIANASDADGSIVSYNWKKISGPSISLWNPDRDKLTLVKFGTGTYVFEVTVTDNDGASASDRVTVVVEDQNQAGSGSITGSSQLSQKVSSDGTTFLEYLPPAYDGNTPYPVIIYLHSRHAEGSNPDLIKNEGPVYFIDQGKEICANGQCFIVLSPQIAAGSGFWKGKLDRFYSYALANYAIDPSRIYLIGFDEGAEDGLIRLTDNTNQPNRWAAAAAVSYSLPNSQACNIASSGAALYLANSTEDEYNAYSDALTFYNLVDGCTSLATRFVSQSGNQSLSGKNSFNPDITDLYAWLLTQSTDKISSNSRLTSEQTTVNLKVEETQQGVIQKNFATGGANLQLTANQEPVSIKITSILGVTIKQVSSQGDLSLDGLHRGMYLYSILDQNDTLIQNGRIIRY